MAPIWTSSARIRSAARARIASAAGDVINLLDLKHQIRNGTGVRVGAPQFGPRRAIFAGLTQRF